MVTKVTLMPDTQCDFLPGQYLSVVMGEQDKRPFSIANAPRDDGSIELHIGAEPQNQYASEVLTKMKQDGSIQAQIGLGDAYLRATNKPIVLLAGGTGFSYTHAILECLVQQNFAQPYFLYWGTRHLEDMYAYERLSEFSRNTPHFQFVPVIEHAESSWQGKTGWVHHAVLEDFADLSAYRVYLAGRFEMAATARDDFCKQGLSIDNLYGDAYAFI
jgi:aquacobalamin reductase/NAD(P)H-flavin reductase